MKLERSTRVDASADAMWNVLCDVEAWPEWTESMTSVRIVSSGTFGEDSVAEVKQPGMPTMRWSVTGWQPHREFTWQSRTAGTTTTGTHTMATDADGLLLTVGIEQHGPTAWLIGLISGRRTRRYLAMECEGLKAAAQATASRGTG